MRAPLLVAPDAFAGSLRAAEGDPLPLRAPEIAAAVGRGIERAGLAPPDLCPVAGGGPGTLEVLVLALGGETRGLEVGAGDNTVRAGFAVVDEGGTAIVEPVAPAVDPSAGTGADASSHATGQLLAAAAATGAAVVVLAAAAWLPADGGAGAVEALRDHGGLRGARLLVLAPPASPLGAPPAPAADALRAAFRARVEPGPAFVLEALDFDERMRAAGAVITGEGRLGAATLRGTVAGEIAVRARQAGVPASAVCAANELTPFDARILDLQQIAEAPDLRGLEEAGLSLARALSGGQTP